MYSFLQNGFHSSIGLAPYEALYGRKCRSHICWDEVNDSMGLGPEMFEETTKKVKMIQERMRGAQDRQKLYADKGRTLEFEVGEKVLLKVSRTKVS